MNATAKYFNARMQNQLLQQNIFAGVTERYYIPCQWVAYTVKNVELEVISTAELKQ